MVGTPSYCLSPSREWKRWKCVCVCMRVYAYVCVRVSAWAHVWVSVSECLCVHMRVVHKAGVIIYSCRTTTDATTTAWVSLPHNWPTWAHYMTKSSDKNLTKCQEATYMSRVLSAWAVRVAYKLQYNTWRDLGRDRVQGCVHMNVYMDIKTWACIKRTNRLQLVCTCMY